MTTDRAIRASDRDRENVVEILRAQYAAGRLTLAEFDERMDAAYTGKTWGDLLDLTNDLPADVRLGADLPRAQAATRPPKLRQTLLPLVPLALAGFLLASIAWGGPHHHHHDVSLLPIWLLVVILFSLRRGVRWHRR